jgi:DNA-binding NarL/FixJ family response regulator
VQKLQPDVVMLDLKLPSMNGMEVLRHISQFMPECRVLLFSAYFSPETVRQALKSGAQGLMEKTAGLAELQKALHALIDGGVYMGPTVQKLTRMMMLEPEKPDSIDALSQREREVLQLIAEGHGTKEIAAMLGISSKTAATHRVNLMAKLNLHGVADLTRYAIDHNIIGAVTQTV